MQDAFPKAYTNYEQEETKEQTLKCALKDLQIFNKVCAQTTAALYDQEKLLEPGVIEFIANMIQSMVVRDGVYHIFWRLVSTKQQEDKSIQMD